MITVIETKDGIKPIGGNPTLTSLDGEIRAPLVTILHESWTPQERAKFGVYLVEPFAMPAGKRAAGDPTYTRVAGRIVQEIPVEDVPTAVELTAHEKVDAMMRRFGVTLAEFKAVIDKAVVAR